MRSFSLVLIRRLLFRPAPSSPHKPTATSHLTLYDHLSTTTLSTLERLLLHSLAHEPSSVVRRKAVDTVSDLANNSMTRGRPWHALQAQAFQMTNAQELGLRESAFSVLGGCPNLVLDLQTEAVVEMFSRGLQDPQSINVRLLCLNLCTSGSHL